jgi:hypothetical protein
MKKLISSIITLLFVLVSTVTVLACNAPASIFTDAGRAWLRWTSIPTAVQYRVSFRPVGNPTWTTVNITAPDTLRTLTNLNPGTQYEYRMRTLCPNNVLSNWSNSQFFTTLSCGIPTSFAVGTVTETTAALSWDPVVNATGYRLRFRPIGNTNWSNVNNITLTNHTLTGLDPGTNYEVEIRTDCNTANSGWGNNQAFTTVSCVLPSNFTVAAVTPTTAELTWDAVGNATSYRLRYRIIGANNWTTRNNITAISLIINNLQPGNNYEIQIQTACGQGLSGWSTSQNFSTLACLTPATAQADSVTPTRAWLSWASAPNAQGYRLQYRRVGDTTWIRVNNIPDTLRTLTNLQGATIYEFQVSTKCGTNRYSDWSASATFATGPCDTPPSITVSNISYTQASISWLAVNYAVRYEIRYRPVGSQTWLYANTTQLSRNLTGLLQGTTYEYEVRTKCGNNNVFSDWSVTGTFTTEGCAVPTNWSVTGTFTTEGCAVPTNWSVTGTFTTEGCAVPTNIQVHNVTETTTDISWDVMPNANRYEISYRVVNTPTWTTVNTTNHTRTLTGLTRCTDYEIRLRARCAGNVYSDSSEIIAFSTVNPYTLQTVNLGPDTVLYVEDSVLCLTLDAGFPGRRYEWSTGDTTQTINLCPFNPENSYVWVRVYEGNCRYASGDRYVRLRSKHETHFRYFDRFAKEYNDERLKVDQQPNNNLFRFTNESESVCRTGAGGNHPTFVITFKDVVNPPTRRGFDDPNRYDPNNPNDLRGCSKKKTSL